MKKIVAILACICMMFSIIPSLAFADEAVQGEVTAENAKYRIGSTYYESFSDAASSVGNNQTIYMLKNDTFTQPSIGASNVTLEVNGNDLSISNVRASNGFFIQDSTCTGVIQINSISGYNYCLGLGRYDFYGYSFSSYLDTSKYSYSYSGAYYLVSKKSLMDSDVSISVDEAKYSGDALLPNVSIRISNYQLVRGRDFTLSASNNTEVGTGTVTIEGIGTYTGRVVKEFNIVESYIINEKTISVEVMDQAYTGTEITPNVDVYYSKSKVLLIEGTDYTMLFSNNTNVGTAAIQIQALGKYQGATTKTFNIKYDLSKAAVHFDKPIYFCNGKPIVPIIKLKIGEVEVPTSYYSISCINNTNIGTATMTINGKNSNCMPTPLIRNFNIYAKRQNIIAQKSYDIVGANSDSFNLNVKTNGDGTGFVYNSSKLNVAHVDSNGNVAIQGYGTSTITVKSIGDIIYCPASIEIKVRVIPYAPTNISIKSTEKGSLKVKLEKKNDTKGFEIAYCKKASFGSGVKVVSTASNSTSTSKTLNKIKSGSYYVKVRTYVKSKKSGVIYSDWSDVQKVKVK